MVSVEGIGHGCISVTDLEKVGVIYIDVFHGAVSGINADATPHNVQIGKLQIIGAPIFNAGTAFFHPDFIVLRRSTARQNDIEISGGLFIVILTDSVKPCQCPGHIIPVSSTGGVDRTGPVTGNFPVKTKRGARCIIGNQSGEGNILFINKACPSKHSGTVPITRRQICVVDPP